MTCYTAPYSFNTERRFLRSTQYIIEYRGTAIRKMYGCSEKDVLNLVFLLNTAFAEGAGHILLNNLIYYNE